jgi:hypothetical protein
LAPKAILSKKLFIIADKARARGKAVKVVGEMRLRHSAALVPVLMCETSHITQILLLVLSNLGKRLNPRNFRHTRKAWVKRKVTKASISTRASIG